VKLAVEQAMPDREDLEYILDVASRMTGWDVVLEGSDHLEPPHFEGSAVTVFALRERPASAGAPPIGSRNSLFTETGADYTTNAYPEDPEDVTRSPRRRRRQMVEVFRDVLRLVVDTETFAVHISVIE
jgi:hypothetical protein